MSTQSGRAVDPLAWGALVMAAPPTLVSLLEAVAIGRLQLERLAPARNSLKATLVSTGSPLPALTAVLFLCAAAAVALGIAALRRARQRPSPASTRVATTAIVLGLLAFPVAVLLGLVATTSL